MGIEVKSAWYDTQPIELGRHGILKRKDIYPLLTDDLFEWARRWKDYKRFGLPHGKVADETEEFMVIVSAFEDEYEDAINSAKTMTALKK